MLFSVFSDLFNENQKLPKHRINHYLYKINAPKITEKLFSDCDRLSENEFRQALNNMSMDKSQSNDGLTKEFYQLFCHDIKATPISAFQRAY